MLYKLPTSPIMDFQRNAPVIIAFLLGTLLISCDLLEKDVDVLGEPVFIEVPDQSMAIKVGRIIMTKKKQKLIRALDYGASGRADDIAGVVYKKIHPEKSGWMFLIVEMEFINKGDTKILCEPQNDLIMRTIDDETLLLMGGITIGGVEGYLAQLSTSIKIPAYGSVRYRVLSQPVPANADGIAIQYANEPAMLIKFFYRIENDV